MDGIVNHMEVYLGKTLYLNLQLFDGQTGLNVLVHVLDANDADLPGSPAVCTHVGYGHYVNDAFKMPYTPEVKAIYKVYLDPGHTVISPLHSDSIDTFSLADNAKISTDLSGSIEDATLYGSVEVDNLDGTILNDILLPGSVQEATLTGSVEESQVTSTVAADEETSGTVEC